MLTRWNPLRDGVQMQSTIESLFDEAWRPLQCNNLALDIDEKDDAYVVRASVPGMRPEDIQVSVHDNVLTICGEIQAEESYQDENRRIIMRERRAGKFSRSVRLQEAIDADAALAEYENGVLSLRLPKGTPVEAGPQRISI